MPFFAPLMLLTLGFAAVPVVLHLFRRHTARKVRWAAWQFLTDSLRRRRRRLMVEELVLLAARTLILVFAALAFARPFLPELAAFGGRGMDRDVVLVMDTSASMGLRRPDGRTNFEAAVEEARELVHRSPKATAFALVDAGSGATARPSVVTASLFTDKDEVLSALDSLQVGSGTMNAPRSIMTAAEVLSGGNNPAKQIVIFGDGQGYGWSPEDEREWAAVGERLNRFELRPAVVWRVPERPETVTNAAIESVVPSRRIISTDRPVGFSATVLNSGSVAIDPGDMEFRVDDRTVARRSVGLVLPGLAKTVEFSHRFLTNGEHRVVTSLSAPDDILADNTVTNLVSVLDELKVLLVNGHSEAEGFARPTAYLEAALLGGVTSRTVRVAELADPAVLRNADVVALCDVPRLPPQAETNLADFVVAGGGLMVLPGDRAETATYRRWRRHDEPVLATVWTNFDGRALFDEAALTNGVEVARRFADDTPAWVLSRFGRGRVGVYAEPLDGVWSQLPARPEFVPLVHELVYELAATNSVTALVDTRLRSREGDLRPLSEPELDQVRVHADLSLARLKDDVLAAVLGRSFGVEIWRPFAIAVLLIIIFEIVFARYVDAVRRGDGFRLRPERREWRGALGYLRALAVLAIVWMLLHWCWVHDERRTVHRRVAVLTDRSLSMRRYDLDEGGATNALTRLDTATNVTARLASRLARRYDVETMSFGGETTEFATALDEVLGRIRTEELAGAVFVTDGRQTGGANAEAAARRFVRASARIATVLVGSATNRADIAIESLSAPKTVFLGDKVRLVASLRADRLNGKRVVCRCFDGDRELEKREFEVKGEDWREEVKFQHEPDTKGVCRYRVTVETDGEDLERANNEWPTDVVVSDDRTNVLIVDRRPRWEFRYLRNLFYARDKSVRLQYVLTEPDRLPGASGEPLPSASAERDFSEAEAGSLPAGRDEWRKFDIVIIGDVAPETLTDEVAAELRFLIEERGATVVFLAGERYLPAAYPNTALAELMPAAFTNEEGAVAAEWSHTRFPVTLSPSGAAHELMRLSDSESENRAIWDSLPEWSARLTGLEVRPGAEILAYAGDSTAMADPLVIVRHRGRGKTVMLATDETWRLRYRKGDVYHHRFWGNLLKWGGPLKLAAGNEFVRLGADSLHYSPFSDVRLAVRLRDAESMPVTNQTPVAVLKFADGGEQRLELVEREDQSGVYEAKLERFEHRGRTEVTLECQEARRILGELWPEGLSTFFSVEEGYQPVEYAHLSADRAVPELLARLTGGKVVAAEDAEELAQAFGMPRGEVTEHVETPLWSHPLVYFLMTFALIAVWIVRKRRGLA